MSTWRRRPVLSLMVLPVPPQLRVDALPVEYVTNPMGIDVARPRFSWKLLSTVRNTVQTAYQLQVGISREDLGRRPGSLWDSGRIGSDNSVFVDYAGPPLASHTRSSCPVRLWHANA